MLFQGQTLEPRLVQMMLHRVDDIIPDEREALAAIERALPKLTERQQEVLLRMNELEVELAAQRAAFEDYNSRIQAEDVDGDLATELDAICQLAAE